MRWILVESLSLFLAWSTLLHSGTSAAEVQFPSLWRAQSDSTAWAGDLSPSGGPPLNLTFTSDGVGVPQTATTSTSMLQPGGLTNSSSAITVVVAPLRIVAYASASVSALPTQDPATCGFGGRCRAQGSSVASIQTAYFSISQPHEYRLTLNSKTLGNGYSSFGIQGVTATRGTLQPGTYLLAGSSSGSADAVYYPTGVVGVTHGISSAGFQLDFSLAQGPIGASQMNPVRALAFSSDGVQSALGTKYHHAAESGEWFSVLPSSEVLFEAEAGTLFTSILSLPIGADSDNLYRLRSSGFDLGHFLGGQSVDFEQLLGAGVSSFTLSEIEGGSPDSFALQLEFSSAPASYRMTAVPEPALALTVGFGAIMLTGIGRRNPYRRPKAAVRDSRSGR